MANESWVCSQPLLTSPWNGELTVQYSLKIALGYTQPGLDSCAGPVSCPISGQRANYLRIRKILEILESFNRIGANRSPKIPPSATGRFFQPLSGVIL
jgi:hypothetical protein